jgi:hypothetical protein
MALSESNDAILIENEQGASFRIEIK